MVIAKGSCNMELFELVELCLGDGLIMSGQLVMALGKRQHGLCIHIMVLKCMSMFTI